MEKIMPFIELLNYIDEKDGVFFLADGSMGAIWQINQVAIEDKDANMLETIANHFAKLLTRHGNATLSFQVILKVSKHDAQKISEYQAFSLKQSEIAAFERSKIDLVHQQSKRIDVILTMRYFPKWSSINKQSSLDHIERIFDDHVVDFSSMINHFENLLSTFQLTHQLIKAQGLIDFLYPILNPKRQQHIKTVVYRPEISLREQVVFNEPQANDSGFMLEDWRMRVLSLKELPLETIPGMLSTQVNNERECLLDRHGDLLAVINFSIPALSESLNRLNWHKGFAFMHQDNWLGDKSIEVIEKKKEIEDSIVKLYREGQSVICARIHFVVFGKTDKEAEAGANQIMGDLSRLQAECFTEQMIGATIFLSCLPLGFDPNYERFIKRAKKILSSNLSHMLPFYGAYNGTQTPAAIYLNQRHEAINLDFFDSSINAHGIVIGASGAGKSFFINDFILQHQRMECLFFVLDKGDSYKKINQLLGGKYLSFDLNNPITINPFFNEPTAENVSFLLSLLSQMASGVSERDRLTREEEGLLQQAITHLYKTHEGEITLTDLIRLLNDNWFNDTHGINSLMGPTLALRLTPFSKIGPYGGFFDGKNQFTIDSRFTVFELANLSAYPDLQSIVVLNLMHFITHFVSHGENRPLRKYLLIDEAWGLLKVRNSADFIASAFKTFRKFRCSVTAITQEIADLIRHDVGMAILANSANKIFLKQEAASVDLLLKALALPMHIAQHMKSLRIVKGKFSEAFIITEQGAGIIQLHSDPLLYWLANSEPRNNQFLIEQMNNGLSMSEAVGRCAKEYPYGLV